MSTSRRSISIPVWLFTAATMSALVTEPNKRPSLPALAGTDKVTAFKRAATSSAASRVARSLAARALRIAAA